jgi:hypothetical protein
MVYKFTVDWNNAACGPSEAKISLQAGADREHLRHIGDLFLLEAEWSQLRRTIEIGAKKSQAHVIMEVE